MLMKIVLLFAIYLYICIANNKCKIRNLINAHKIKTTKKQKTCKLTDKTN